MDLSTMNAKLESGKYKNRFAFEEDFRLMITNCKLYNAPGSYAHNEAVALEDFFGKQWTRINKTLEAADKAADHKPVVPQVPVGRSVRDQLPEHQTAPLQTPLKAHVRASASTPTPVPSTARPTIKLKVGGNSVGGGGEGEVSAVAAAKATPKPKGRKPKESKPVAMPPPPPPEPVAPTQYFPDERDADLDLLEEVIAIEREKDEENRKHRSSSSAEKERERPREAEKDVRVPKLVIGKRKKPAGDITEDEILALATPSKKKIPHPAPLAGPSSVAPSASPERNTVSPPSQPQTNGGSSHKSKEKVVKPQLNTSPQPRPSTKGKEKEVSTPAPVATTSPAPVAKAKKQPVRHETPTLINEKKCRDILKILVKSPDARIFLRPVDPIQDGCPTYVQIRSSIRIC